MCRPGGVAKSPAQTLHDALRKRLAGCAKVTMLGAADFSAEPSGCLPTPITLLNTALGGGLLRGRITEVFGPEQCGKTTFGLSCLAINQQHGGVSGYLDTEYATSKQAAIELAKVNAEELIHLDVPNLESLLTTVNEFFDLAPRNVPVALLVDSVAGKASQRDLDTPFDKTKQQGVTPKMLRLFFQKVAELIAEREAVCIFTNHETYKVQPKPWEQPYTTPGGTPLRFWTSTRLRLQHVSMVKQNDSTIVGTKGRVTVIKHRADAPYRKVEFYTMLYPPHKGLDDATSVFMYLREKGFFVVKKGGWFQLDETGPSYQREDLLSALRNSTSPLGIQLRQEAATLFQHSWSLTELDPAAKVSTLDVATEEE